ncbi:sulfotransferase [Roseovarius salinarum]|uniref:sulfotransferase n=1 Tax=Roseovarius salinarum TaxID=1981892 RepID=UPI000C33D8C6|nr:sulfotransferase [Roseovarius salinarum]
MSQDLLDRVAMRGNTAKYFDFFSNRCEGKKVCGEITPTYSLLHAEHFQKIRQAHPDVRPIFIMREPVDRYWSAMRMSEREGSTVNAIELASRNLGNWQHIARGRYDLTLKALHAAFGEGGYLVLFYEELFQDSAIHEICDYLSIRYSGADFTHRHNSSPSNDALPQELESQIYSVL